MVGLSIVLESQKETTTTTSRTASNKKSAQVINKVITINNKPTPPSSPSSTTASFKSSSFSRCSFLDQCFLCKQTLLPTKDIYMYNGDKAFCSVECRCRRILMDEEDELKLEMANKTATTKNNNGNGRDKCSLAAMRPTATSSPCLRKSRYY